MADDLKLPPGASLVQDENLKLPPGATLVSPPLSMVPGTPGSESAASAAEQIGTSLANSAKNLYHLPLSVLPPALTPGSTIVGPRKYVPNILQGNIDEAGKAYDAAKSGDYPGLAIHAAGALVPVAGPFINQTAEKAMTRPYEAATDLASAIAAPDVLGGIGKGMMRVAEPLAETSLGIRNVDRAYGRTPGRAALDETTGVRPGTVASQAQNRLGDINSELEGVVGGSNAPVSLKPTRDLILDEIQKAQARNSTITPPRLQPMLKMLNEPEPGFAGQTQYPPGANTPITISHQPSPIVGAPPKPVISYGAQPAQVVAETQNPASALGLKRQFSQDFIRNWSPATDTKGQLGVARQAYRSQADQLHRAVPESADLDERSSSLIPVADRAEMKDLNAGPLARIAGRFGAHTGALAGGLYGASQYGIPGALAGLAIPEMLADPTAQMVAARGLNAGGKVLQSPVVIRPAQVAPLIRTQQEQQ